MATYVLAHGAWQGGWAWKKVARRLAAAGHEALRPTYTGLGERFHLGHKGINLDTHIDDICGVFEAEEISDVILAGHSYGGMVITGVAERLADKISALVYIDAFLPANGESSFSRAGEAGAEAMRKAAAEGGDGWRVPKRPSSFHGIIDPEDAALYDRRCVGQPIGCMEQPITHTEPWKRVADRTYIHCTKNDPSPFGIIAGKLEGDPDWALHRLDCGHQVHLDMPDELTAILLGVAGDVGR